MRSINFQYALTAKKRSRGALFIYIVAVLSILCKDAVHGYAHDTTVINRRKIDLRPPGQQPSLYLRNEKQKFLQPRNNFGRNSALSIRGGAIGNNEVKFAKQALSSVFAGSIAGAIGVGVAFPLDTLKTKYQVLSQQQNDDGAANSVGMLKLIQMIYKTEGIGGFYGGVRGAMAGQAIIKCAAFSVNTIALSFLNTAYPALGSIVTLLLAACFAGFITSFFVTPIERIKVMMQASGSGVDGTPTYSNEIQCIKAVLENDGWIGLMGRGLGPTLNREIPAYGFYFLLYGVLSSLPFTTSLGKLAPLVNGALSGMASWLPVYPVDVVKTLVQNSDGNEGNPSAFAVAKDLYATGGINAFFNGLKPKMLRAAVNHAVVFFVYDFIMSALL